jgi:hypothetical protein
MKFPETKTKKTEVQVKNRRCIRYLRKESTNIIEEGN